MDSQDARQQLEQMLRELDSSTAVLEHEGAGESSEISHVDQHPGDTAGELTDTDQQNALLENNADQRAQVEAALAPPGCRNLRHLRRLRQVDPRGAPGGASRGGQVPGGPGEGRSRRALDLVDPGHTRAHEPRGRMSTDAPVRPAKRRGVRLLIALLIVLVALVILDRAADFVAERRLAAQLQEGEQLSSRPEVHIGGFPFLTQVIRGRYGQVDLSARDVERDGVRVSDVDLTLKGVEVSVGDALAGRVREVPVRSGRGTARLSYADIDLVVKKYAGALGQQVQVASGGPGKVRVSGPLGLDLTVAVSVRDDTLMIEPDQAALDTLPGLVRSLVDGAVGQPLPLPQLPFGATLKSGMVDADGLSLVATANGAVLRTQ